jgi:exodeoxyribonuclease V alpha subunit
MILTGGPGTGKTTVIKGIIELLSSMGMMILLAAPTGKAAKRMSELTGRQAKTIHRLLEYNPALGYCYNEMNPLPGDVLIVDETSMVNLPLMETLIRAVPNNMRVILVGDIDQLPCIGPGNILRDCINSGVVPVVKLDKIFRQSENSNIVKNAHHVKNGESLVIKNTNDSDFFFMKRDDDIMFDVVDLVVNRLPKKYGYKPIDIQVLTPMKKCEIGVDKLNIELQKAINPEGTEVKYGKFTFRVGDKIIQTVNNYEKEVFNGDSGFIDAINLDLKTVFVRFDERIVEYSYTDLEELSLAYAMTIHKSQGSEYPAVVIPLTYPNKIMMTRNLLYTAITRAKELCVIIGSKRIAEIGIDNALSYKRKTMLKERLKEL